MATITDLLTPEEIQKITSLEIVARLVVEGFCAGLHRSPHQGFSVEFRQHRPYVAGDEIRHLDWKVYGKTDRYYIRQYEEETNLRATILLDKSGSMGYRSGAVSKLDYAVRLAACLSYLLLRQPDAVGLVTFDRTIDRYVPPRSQPNHLKVLLQTLQDCRPAGETELHKVFHELVPKIHRRGLLIVLSDCFGDLPELIKALAHFRHAHHELLVFQIWDRAELEFPFTQWTRFECLERQGHRLLVDPGHIRKAYRQRVRQFQQELRQGCHKYHIDLVPLVTDEPYADSLARYVSLRKKYG